MGATVSKKNPANRSAKETEFLKKLAKAINVLASQKKISLELMAYESGVSKGFIYDLAKVKANPSVLTLFRIAEANNLKLSKFLKDL